MDFVLYYPSLSVFRTSGAHVRPKEAILICLALSLLVFSGMETSLRPRESKRESENSVCDVRCGRSSALRSGQVFRSQQFLTVIVLGSIYLQFFSPAVWNGNVRSFITIILRYVPNE